MGAGRQFLETPSPWKRGLFHMLGGLFICIAGLFLPGMFVVISLCLATAIFLSFELIRIKSPAINRWFFSFFKLLVREGESSRLTGTSYMLIAALIAFLVFPRDIAALGLAFLAVGDSMATIVGKKIGRRKFLGKTLEGNLACFTCCVVVGLVFYYAGLGVPLLTILLGALCATVVEAMPLPVNDNLTIPLLSGAVMTVMQL